MPKYTLSRLLGCLLALAPLGCQDDARLVAIETHLKDLKALVSQLPPGQATLAVADAPEPANCNQTGVICTYAGNGIAGFNGDNIPALKAAFYSPQDVFVSPVSHSVYVVDFNNHRVRKIDSQTRSVVTVMGSGSLGDQPQLATDPMIPATEANLNHPTDLTMNAKGHLVLAAWHNWKIKYVDGHGQMGVLVGMKTNSFSGDGKLGTEAHLNFASSAVYDSKGNLYISDQGNYRVRRMEPTGLITTIAGTGVPGFSGDGGPAIKAQFSLPSGSNAIPAGKIALAPDGKLLYLADTLNHRVRQIDLETGLIGTLAGSGAPGHSGDGGPAVLARLSSPIDVFVASDRSVYIADSGNHTIRKVTPAGTITTVAGTGQPGFSGDGGTAAQAQLKQPAGVFLAEGYLYIADTANHRIRRIKLEDAPAFSVAAQTFSNRCAKCHGTGGEGGIGPQLKGLFNCHGWEAYRDFIAAAMPQDEPGSCQGTCARDMALYIPAAFNQERCD